MIEHGYHDEIYEVICDLCDYTDYYETNINFFKLINCMKSDGWKIKKIKNEWKHFCKECSEKEIICSR